MQCWFVLRPDEGIDHPHQDIHGTSVCRRQWVGRMCTCVANQRFNNRGCLINLYRRALPTTKPPSLRACLPVSVCVCPPRVAGMMQRMVLLRGVQPRGSMDPVNGAPVSVAVNEM